MSSSGSSSYIIDADQSRLEMNSLFIRSNSRNGTTSKPYSERSLPASFYRQPQTEYKSKIRHGQHTKNQWNSSGTPLHSRTVSEGTPLDVQMVMNPSLSQNNTPSTPLPLPDGWEEKQTHDGQTYYVDHITRGTTWTDPRPNHYAAFQSYCASLPLPEGYVKKTDFNDRIYFINQKTKQTSSNDPRLTHYRSLMTKRFDVPSIAPSQSDENLAEKLLTIAKERQVLQQRTQELEKLEADLRKKINGIHPTNNSIMTNQTTVQSFFDDLHPSKRYDSTDSGLSTGYHSSNELFAGSSDFSDDILFSDSTDFNNFFMDMNVSVQNPSSTSPINNSQLKTKSNNPTQQWPSNTYF
ncbi:hypothetical protein I4U23_025680 [Adineta vaga]|nr:hypothetical protein I4U23_025680 [Adineta vaga]